MFVLAHISDLHFPPLPEASAHTLMNKRILGYLSWHRKRKYEHRQEVLDALVADLLDDRPNHICVTGDLTNISLPGEFVTAANWLTALGRPNDVSVIPGNHDAYVKGALEQGAKLWAPWMTGDDGHMGFPYLRRRGRISFIGISSALATLPGLASGRLGKDQRQKLEACLSAERENGQFTVVMIHHPPQKGAEGRRKGLDDQEDFRALISRTGAGLILHGHSHRAIITEIDGPSGPVPVLGAGSSSSIGSHKGFGHYYRIVLDITGPRHSVKAEDRHYDAAKGRFLGGYVHDILS